MQVAMRTSTRLALVMTLLLVVLAGSCLTGGHARARGGPGADVGNPGEPPGALHSPDHAVTVQSRPMLSAASCAAGGPGRAGASAGTAG